MKNDGVIKVALQNLGLYNEGILSFKWVSLPATDAEIEEARKAIGISAEYEEEFLGDWESEIPGVYDQINQWSNIEELNEWAEELNDLSEYQIEAINAYLELIEDNFSDALELAQSGDYIIYPNCDNMRDVAEQYMQETGGLDEIPSYFQSYIDFEAMGRDMKIEGYYQEMENKDGYIQILR